MKTYFAKPEEINRQWHVIDAEGHTLGRLATVVADLLRGKGKPLYTPNVDCGDFVIIINAEKIQVTGKKNTDKLYRHHTGWPGGFRSTTFNKLINEHPERVIEHAVRGMLQHNRLGRAQYGKLKVYAGAEHPHAAQQPKVFEIAKKEAVRG
ncbi:50S ribosomal protein L13 [bacterium]|nr:50S ribosomal protein L13 [bacterium]